MDLLLFYITQIFTKGSFPTPSDICGGAEMIAPMCYSAVSLSLIALLAFPFVSFLIVKRLKTNVFATFVLCVISIFLCFVLADYSMKLIEEPVRYGIEWFTLLYYFWCFIIINIFFLCLLLVNNRKTLLTFGLATTVVFSLVFAYTGRGNFEQITPIAGGLFAEFSWSMLWLSFSFRLLVFIFAFSLFFTFVSTLHRWVINGVVEANILKKNLLLCLYFVPLLIIPTISIPMGEYFNKTDTAEAKSYIDEIKMRVVKYYYENGEYPKFIEDMLPEGRSPRLLERHEFFTMGIRGTYYFSRPDKFCFIFQNPVRKFGYYSVTSERDWRYNQKVDSYDESFVNLCDESEKNFEDLISNHLGVNPDDRLINELTLEAGVPTMPVSATKRASKVLEQKIIERSKKDPEIKDLIKPKD